MNGKGSKINGYKSIRSSVTSSNSIRISDSSSNHNDNDKNKVGHANDGNDGSKVAIVGAEVIIIPGLVAGLITVSVRIACRRDIVMAVIIERQ